MSERPRGRLITIEGGDGVGKTTQTGLLAAALERSGIAVLETREPGGSPGAEAVRQLLVGDGAPDWEPFAEALLMVAARCEHVAKLIAPALAAGSWVVCDRFVDSTTAYQGYGRGLALDRLATLHRLALGDLAPDLTLVLDLPVAAARARADQRSAAADRFERLDRSFHERLRQGFRAVAADNPARCVLIDATGDPQSVHRAVLGAIERRLGVKLG